MNFTELFSRFFVGVGQGITEIYNEFSLQHELGIFLREQVSGSGFKVQFERNVSFFGLDKSAFQKKEIDIVIFDPAKSIRHAIELKFPRNGQYPEQMFSTCKDIRFVEQLTGSGFQKSFVIMVADDSNFYAGGKTTGIYGYFRKQVPLQGTIAKPTGRKKQTFQLRGNYQIRWNAVTERLKYTVVEVQ